MPESGKSRDDFPRYRVEYPVDIGSHAGMADDLDEAGRIYLGTPGATDIYDTHEGRYLNPEVEVPVAAEAYAKWHEEQQRGAP